MGRDRELRQAFIQNRKGDASLNPELIICWGNYVIKQLNVHCGPFHFCFRVIPSNAQGLLQTQGFSPVIFVYQAELGTGLGPHMQIKHFSSLSYLLSPTEVLPDLPEALSTSSHSRKGKRVRELERCFRR